MLQFNIKMFCSGGLNLNCRAGFVFVHSTSMGRGIYKLFLGLESHHGVLISVMKSF